MSPVSVRDSLAARRLRLRNPIGLLAILIVLVSTAAAAPVQASDSILPVITSPSQELRQVPGGWEGPIKADFTGAAEGVYSVGVSCSRYYTEYSHTVPEDGDLFSTMIPALPQNQRCSAHISSAQDSSQSLSSQNFTTARIQFRFTDLVSTKRFFPRRVDDYFDELRIDYWLTQPARITADIVNSDGRVVTTLEANHQRYGGFRLFWDGKTSGGSVPPQGRYRARMTATNVDGEIRRGTLSFALTDLLKVRPGAIGVARAGMTTTQAMATGQFNRNVRYTVPGVCTTVYPLQPKEPMTWDYSVFVKNKRLAEITTNTAAVSLPKGLNFPPTVAQVRGAYAGKVAVGIAGHGNNALFARKGNRWLAFTFNSYSYNRDLRPTDKATSFSVARGRRPAGMQTDGC